MWMAFGEVGGVWRPEQSCDFHSPDHFLLQPFQTSGNLNIPCRSSLIESTYDPVVFAVRLSGVFSCLWKLFPVGCGNVLRPQTPEVSAEAASRERAVLSLFLFSLKALKQQSITSKPRTLTSALLFTGGLELPAAGPAAGQPFCLVWCQTVGAAATQLRQVECVNTSLVLTCTVKQCTFFLIISQYNYLSSKKSKFI